MRKNDTHAFVNQVILCLMVTICFGGTIGLGTVWMRHQISLTANARRVLAAELAEIKRRTDETAALVESEQSPALLRQRNTDWRIGLVPVSETQVVHVTVDLVRRLRARANLGLYDRGENNPAATVSVRLALGP